MLRNKVNNLSSLIIYALLTVLTLLTTACSGGGSSDSDGEDLGGDGAGQSAIIAKVAACGAADTPLRVMPLGDSITEAKGGYSSYRYYFWQTMKSAGCNIDLVGSRRGVSEGHRDSEFETPAQTDFDQHHEGHWDYTTDQILRQTGEWVRNNPADVILLHVGSNDLFRGHGVESTATEIAQIIDTIHSERPEVLIVLAQIIPARKASTEITSLNNQLSQIALSRSTKDQPVLIVDQFSGFDLSSMSYEGIHPNSIGERQIGERFANALLAY